MKKRQDPEPPRARRLIVAGLVLLAMAAYAGVPGNRFTNWDDEHLIVKNTAIRSLDPLPLLRSFHLSYPPLTVFTHCVDYFFWGLNPVGYHVTDLLLYALVVATFFLLAERITGDARAAGAAAALFAVHPLHVESVAWLSSRKDGVAMACYLAAFLAYLAGSRSRGVDYRAHVRVPCDGVGCANLRDSQSRRAHLNAPSGSAREEGEGRGFVRLSALLYLGAVWAKPLMITLPLALILYETLLRKRSIPRALRRLLPFAVPLALTALAAVFLDPQNETRLPWHGGSPWATARVVARVMGDYARMLVFPVNLNALYLVVIPPRFLDVRCLLPLAAGALLVALALKGARSTPLLSFCVGWGIVSLLPVMQFIPSNVIKADRYLYLPSAALCLLCGAAWARASRGGRRGPGGPMQSMSLRATASGTEDGARQSDPQGRPERREGSRRRDCFASLAMTTKTIPTCGGVLRTGVWIAGLAAVVALLFALTAARCAVWRDSAALWESSVAQNPSNPDARNNLGIAYARARRYDDAAAELGRALGLRPDFPSARNNLANVYLLTGRYDDALRELEKATGLTKDIVYAANGYITMGIAWEKKGDCSRALEAYEKALRLNPAYLDDSMLRARIAGCRKKLAARPGG